MCEVFFRRSMSESLFSHFLWLMVLCCRRGPWGLNAFYDSSSHSRIIFIENYFFRTIKQEFTVHIFYEQCQHERTTKRDFTTWQHLCSMCIVTILLCVAAPLFNVYCHNTIVCCSKCVRCVLCVKLHCEQNTCTDHKQWLIIKHNF